MPTDKQFFADHPDRKARIRTPLDGEERAAFLSLGAHNSDRRRVIVIRVPDGPYKGMLMPVPMLLFGDETLEDRDDILLPVVTQIMLEARGVANDR